MCGIAAVLSSHGVERDALERAVAALHHRGPDAAATWVSPDGRVGLGHARLSIIDLQTGDQPIANEDESVHIVVNGEFYDFEQIREELEGRGHRFRTKSDSEIALHLYEDMGPQCLHRLRGEFAFVIWDKRNDLIFAARDRFGVKPLFFASTQGTLRLASEVKALFAMGTPAAWDPEWIYSGSFMRPTDLALYDGVRQIPPGHYMIAVPDGHRLIEYWDVTYPTQEELDASTLSDEELIAGFREVLEDSVKTRLRADVEVGCYLSGGIDSCTTLGLAALHHPDPIQAFTLSFEGPQYDERAIAEKQAEMSGAKFHPIPITQADLAANYEAAVMATETPFFNAHGVAKFLLSRAVRDAGYKVVLTGEGSDEILAGYPPFRQDMLLHHTEGQDPAEIERLLAQLEEANQVSKGLLLPSGEVDDCTIARELLGFVPTWIETFSASTIRMQGLLDDDYLAARRQRDGLTTLFTSLDVRRRMQGRNPVNISLYLWAKTCLPSYILTVLGDRMEMAHSIEGRVPFLDHHVAEFLHGVPVALKIRGMTEKYILREAVRDVITDEVYKRQKHPFLSPPATLHPDEELDVLTQDTLRGPDLEAVPFFDAGKVRAYLDSLEGDDVDMGDRVVADQVINMVLCTVFLQRGLGLAS